MKCPVCEKQDRKSKIYGGMSWFSTAMPTNPYYDEDGKYHCHDPNQRSASFTCSNGHEFGVSKYLRCCDEYPGSIEYFADEQEPLK